MDPRGELWRASGRASNVVVINTSRRSVRSPVITGSAFDVSHNGCALDTTGECTKLYGGGGEATAHSRPGAPHGFGPAMGPLRQVRSTLTRKMTTLTASVTAPTDARKLSGPHPVDA